jgi:hypothetical protein
VWRVLKRRTRKMEAGRNCKDKPCVNCEEQPCEYSKDGKHKFGLVAWRHYRCQNKNEKGEQCPCDFHD